MVTGGYYTVSLIFLDEDRNLAREVRQPLPPSPETHVKSDELYGENGCVTKFIEMSPTVLLPPSPPLRRYNARRNNLLETSCRKRFVTALPG